MGKTAAIATFVSYVRTSTKGQKDAFTIKAQRTTVQRLQAQYTPTLGLTPHTYGPRGNGVLEDDGISGRLLAPRAEFSAFIDALEAGTIVPPPAYLIVPDTSRLSRQDTFSADDDVQMQSELAVARINTLLRIKKVKVIDVKGVHGD